MNDTKMPVRPSQVPALRDGVLRMWKSPAGQIAAAEDAGIDLSAVRSYEDLANVRIVFPGERGFNGEMTLVEWVAGEIGLLASASLYWVSKDMSQLLKGAAESLPSATLVESDAPAECGFLVFEEPIPAIDAKRENDKLCIAAFEWAFAWVKGRRCLHIGFYDDANRLEIRPEILNGSSLFSLGASTWGVGTELDDIEDMYPERPNTDERFRASILEDRRLVHAFFLLVKQKVTQVEVRRPTRPEVRRAERAGKTPPEVRVVNLREIYRPSAPADGESQVNWSRRWMVSGHWRQQYYRSSDTHRPIYIHPFVKGPATAPLIIKEKVNAWRH